MSESRTNRARPRLRRTDVLAVIGLTVLLVGAGTFKIGADYLPAWVAWLIAPLFWYCGFGLLVGWAMARMLSAFTHHTTEEEPTAEVVQYTRAARVRASNFVEHDVEEVIG